MKKYAALLLAAVMILCFHAAWAESTVIESSDGSFSISFLLPEDTVFLSGGWNEDGTLYQANIQGSDNLYFYLAVAAPSSAEADNGEETAAVTYNEDHGYSDAHILDMLAELYEDASDSYETGVWTTAYGTKLAVVRFSDEAPHAYIFTVWNGYEIGVTVTSPDTGSALRPITDEQIQRVVDFLSEVWMTVPAAEAPAA